MRQAIVTKYLNPTNSNGARILCKAQAGKKVYPWDHALNVEANYAQAARMFAEHWGWPFGTWHGGALPDGSYVFVLVEAPPEREKDYIEWMGAIWERVDNK